MRLLCNEYVICANSIECGVPVLHEEAHVLPLVRAVERRVSHGAGGLAQPAQVPRVDGLKVGERLEAVLQRKPKMSNQFDNPWA